MDFQKITGVLPSEKYLLAAAAFVLPLYDFILAVVLNRFAEYSLARPLYLVPSLVASLGFFIFVEKTWKKDLKASVIVSTAAALLIPFLYVTKGAGFASRPLLYALPTGIGLLAALAEAGLKRRYQELGLETWRDNRSIQIGFLHAAVALEMYILSRDIKIAETASQILENGNILSIAFVAGRPLVMLPLQFLVAAAPVYLYQKKKLKAPLISFLTWLAAGVGLFFLILDIYPITSFYGGINILPPQPDYLLRPWLPLILVIVAWKIEEKYRGIKNEDSG